MKLFPHILSAILMIILTGCSTAKMAGDSLIIGSSGPSNPYSGIMSTVGHALSLGSNVASRQTSHPDRTINVSSVYWDKPMMVKETVLLTNHISAISDENRKEGIQALVARATDEAGTGIFKDADSRINNSLAGYLQGHWFLNTYEADNSKDNIRMYCNKQYDACTLALESERVDLPIYNTEAKLLNTRLGGLTATIW